MGRAGISAFLARLASFSRLILVDKRGIGRSERVPPARSHGSRRVWRISSPCSMPSGPRSASSSAGRRAVPSRSRSRPRTPTARGGCRCTRVARDTARRCPTTRSATAKRSWTRGWTMLRTEWGTSAFAREFYDWMAPSLAADPEAIAWFAAMMPVSADPETVAAATRLTYATDVRDALPSIVCPTIVFARRDDVLCPFDEVRWLADHIAGAMFVPLEGADHPFWAGDTTVMLDRIEGFAASARESGSWRARRSRSGHPGLKPTTKVGTLGPYRGRLGLAWVIAPLVVGRADPRRRLPGARRADARGVLLAARRSPRASGRPARLDRRRPGRRRGRARRRSTARWSGAATVAAPSTRPARRRERRTAAAGRPRSRSRSEPTGGRATTRSRSPPATSAPTRSSSSGPAPGADGRRSCSSSRPAPRRLQRLGRPVAVHRRPRGLVRAAARAGVPRRSPSRTERKTQPAPRPRGAVVLRVGRAARPVGVERRRRLVELGAPVPALGRARTASRSTSRSARTSRRARAARRVPARTCRVGHDEYWSWGMREALDAHTARRRQRRDPSAATRATGRSGSTTTPAR